MPSVITEPVCPVTSAATGMASETITLAQHSRSSPAGQYLYQQQPLTVPSSTSSSPSASPIFQDGSPALETDPTGSCWSSEGLVAVTEMELEDLDSAVLPLELPEPLTVPPTSTVQSLSSLSSLSRRTSTTSLAPALRSPGTPSMGGAMGEAMKSITRRSSNSFRRVQSFVTRRQSSSHPRSRDGSVGPGIVRRETNAIVTDSDDDCAVEREECNSIFSADGTAQEFSPAATSTGTSIASAAPASRLGMSAEAYPLAMIQGTPMTKFGKKKSMKKIKLIYDPVSAKISWEKGRSSTKDIYIDDIREIRTAEDIGQYRLDYGLEESMASRFFSVMYMPPGKTTPKPLHLVTDSEAAFKIWTQTLEDICNRRQAFTTSLMAFDDKAIQKWWHRETEKLRALGEEKEPGHLSIDHICRSLHIHIPIPLLGDNLRAATGKVGRLERTTMDLVEFQKFVQLMKSRKDVSAVYGQVTGNRELGITKDEFFAFLRDQQRESFGDEAIGNWESIFAHYARKGRSRDATSGAGECTTMSEAGFAAFLSSPPNSVLPKEPDNYTLDRPMSEYYISSSHNTYLLGRQVAGISSVEGYIAALQKNCRCIEIDCWDGADDQPVVMHGRTWTPSISFIEVIKTINKYAFVKNKFPVWISLEVRCGFATQANMVKIMMEVFGERLLTEPLEGYTDSMPSPSQLRERFLIKVKESQPIEESARGGERVTRRRGNSQPLPYSRPMVQDIVPGPASPLLSPTSLSRPRLPHVINTITEGRVHDASSNPSECESESEKDSTSKKVSSKINPVLSKLGVYCVGIPFEGFDTPEAKRFNHIFSFKEQTFAKKSQPGDQKRALCLHNMRYMMRVYPNATRIGSSNFDPLPYWKRGVQMVALNWQTFDLGMQKNQAMFGGGTDYSGYVLKPEEAREFKRMPNIKPEDWFTKRPRKSVSFSIKVISAQQLMRPFNFGDRRSMDPYVEVEVLLADDRRNKSDYIPSNPGQELKQRTKIIRQNGYNPVFDESYDFDITTKYPDLIQVRWAVKLADRSDPIATFTAKLSNLKQGYRTLPLYTEYGDKCLFSTLFCQIKKGEIKDVMVNLSQEALRNSAKLKTMSRGVKSFSSIPSPKSSTESSRA